MSAVLPPPAQGCAWVTGASSGIGRALALRLAREGWRVAASARSEDALDELAKEAAGTPRGMQFTDDFDSSSSVSVIDLMRSSAHG